MCTLPGAHFFTLSKNSSLSFRTSDRSHWGGNPQPKPPLCKGRWREAPEGLSVAGAIPQSPSVTAPFTQGARYGLPRQCEHWLAMTDVFDSLKGLHQQSLFYFTSTRGPGRNSSASTRMVMPPADSSVSRACRASALSAGSEMDSATSAP